MHFQDKVYGEYFVDEPIIRDLILSKSFERLKGVQQYGLPQAFYPVDGYSRHEHSIGVFLLLRHLRAAFTEQVAGLLHDVSHTAFSHVTDGIFGSSHLDNAQDLRHRSFMLTTELPAIISRHGLDFDKLADLERHSLLDREPPDLCADRVDYSLREFHSFMPEPKLRKLVDDLRVFEGRIIFASYESAQVFGVNYMTCHIGKWASVEKTVRQHLFEQALRLSLRDGTLTIDDLFMDDQYALSRLTRTKNPEVLGILRLLKGSLAIEEDDKNPQIVLKRRFRYVDPEMIEKGRVFRLSAIDSTFREILSAQKDIHKKELRVNVLHKIGQKS